LIAGLQSDLSRGTTGLKIADRQAALAVFPVDSKLGEVLLLPLLGRLLGLTTLTTAAWPLVHRRLALTSGAGSSGGALRLLSRCFTALLLLRRLDLLRLLKLLWLLLRLLCGCTLGTACLATFLLARSLLRRALVSRLLRLDFLPLPAITPLRIARLTDGQPGERDDRGTPTNNLELFHGLNPHSW
jgi:hypothetical protein